MSPIKRSMLSLRTFTLFSILLMGVFATTVSSNVEDGMLVAASIAPLAGIVEAIGGYRVSVEVLIPEGVEPHIFQASPELIQKVMMADLIVHTGHFTFEKDIVEATGKPNVGLKEYKKHGLSLSPMPGYNHGEYGTGENMHGYWLKPYNALAIAETVTEKLIELDPDYSDVYENGLHLFEDKINALKSRIDKLSEEYGLRKLKAVVTFPAEAYVAETFGIKVEDSLVVGENVFVSGKELVRIEDELKRGEVDLILSSEMAKQMKAGEFAQRLASDTSSPLVYVRVLTFGNLYDYTALIMYNAGALTASIEILKHNKTTFHQMDQWPYLIAIAVLAITGLVEAVLLVKREKR